MQGLCRRPQLLCAKRLVWSLLRLLQPGLQRLQLLLLERLVNQWELHLLQQSQVAALLVLLQLQRCCVERQRQKACLCQ